ncbi:coproporphyrinogen-III oxidase family protein, partial [Prevotella sp.]
MKTGIYIHIPFCKSRCIYCGFYSSTLFGLQHNYATTLIKEMHLRRSEFNGLGSIDSPNSVDTIYIGGGTPSTLPLSDIQDILNSVSECFPGNPREVTIEVNPDDITPEFVSCLRSFGINRISMGIQTFDDSRLQFLHRRHTSSQAIDAVRIIKEAGIENISIDLMFGFPNQTLDEWAADVQTAISLSPTHISAYSLMYEEGTPLYRMLSEGKITQIDDEASLSMY